MLELPPVVEMKPDARLRRVHYDWLEAGEQRKHTKVVQRFVDDRQADDRINQMEIDIDTLCNKVIAKPSGRSSTSKDAPSGFFSTVSVASTPTDVPAAARA